MGYFRKAISELSAEDIELLVAESECEGDDLEFKELPVDANGGVKPSLRDKIAREVVAFATAEGGTLVLGIKETKDPAGPNRAEAIIPIPDCESVADCLARSMRDVIEPPLPLLQVRGISTADHGYGVIVVDVPRDRKMAPSREGASHLRGPFWH